MYSLNSNQSLSVYEKNSTILLQQTKGIVVTTSVLYALFAVNPNSSISGLSLPQSAQIATTFWVFTQLDSPSFSPANGTYYQSINFSCLCPDVGAQCQATIISNSISNGSVLISYPFFNASSAFPSLPFPVADCVL